MKLATSAKLNQQQQNDVNKALAAEYKTATDKRRHEILEEYYRSNESFTCVWRQWEREHWEELTQNFVTHWHRAFMEFKPTTPTANFNLFMHCKYKSRASMDHKMYLRKTSKWNMLEDSYAGEGEKENKKVQKELYIHPSSETDKSLLRWNLNRKLDLDPGEVIIMDNYFFGDMTQNDVARTFFKPGGKRTMPKTKLTDMRACQCFDYQSKLRRLLNKMALCLRPDDLR